MAMFAYMTTNYDSIEMTRSYEVEANGEFSRVPTAIFFSTKNLNY